MKSVDVDTTLTVLTVRRAFLCTTTGLGLVRRNPVLMSVSVSVSIAFDRTQSNMLLVKLTFENNLPYYTIMAHCITLKVHVYTKETAAKSKFTLLFQYVLL